MLMRLLILATVAVVALLASPAAGNNNAHVLHRLARGAGGNKQHALQAAAHEAGVSHIGEGGFPSMCTDASLEKACNALEQICTLKKILKSAAEPQGIFMITPKDVDATWVS
jgi:hypothetical protein